jgi:hypothetical protein
MVRHKNQQSSEDAPFLEQVLAAEVAKGLACRQGGWEGKFFQSVAEGHSSDR